MSKLVDKIKEYLMDLHDYNSGDSDIEMGYESGHVWEEGYINGLVDWEVVNEDEYNELEIFVRTLK
jgi:hypothetical protein